MLLIRKFMSIVPESKVTLSILIKYPTMGYLRSEHLTAGWCQLLVKLGVTNSAVLTADRPRDQG